MKRSRKPLPPGFAAVWSTVAVDLVGFGIVLPLLPIYSRRFGASPFEAALLVAAFSGASFLAAPFWGRLSDRVGRKPILIVSLAGTAVGSLVTGLAGSLVLLYVGRVIDGVSGASVAVAQASVSDVASPDERPRLFGLLGAAFGLGFVGGPAIGAVAALGGPRLPFLLAAAIAGINAVIAVRRLPETHSGGAPGSWQFNPFAGLAGVQGVGRLVAVAFLALVAFSGFEATLPLFGQRHLGFSLTSTGAIFAAVGVGIVLVEGGAVRPLVRRWGEATTLGVGLVVNAAGLGLLAAASSWLLAAPALALLAGGQGLVQPTMASAIAGRAPADRRGRALGAQQSAAGLARVMGPVAGGALLGGHASGLPYLLGAVLTVLAVVLAVVPPVRPRLLMLPSSNIGPGQPASRQEAS
jgi:DHA1 family tetracycline resistance protein-like MFS transporter